MHAEHLRQGIESFCEHSGSLFMPRKEHWFFRPLERQAWTKLGWFFCILSFLIAITLELPISNTPNTKPTQKQQQKDKPENEHKRKTYQQYSQHQTNTQMTGMTLSLQLQVPG